MPHSLVNISVTFVFTKLGNTPAICIDSPINVLEHLGETKSNKYVKLKSQLTCIVDDPDGVLFFHKDSGHKYTFDDSMIQNGAIYGLKVRLKSDGNGALKKVTENKLVPVQLATEFQKYREDISEVIYEKRDRRNWLKRMFAYSVKICVVLVKEKEKQPT